MSSLEANPPDSTLKSLETDQKKAQGNLAEARKILQRVQKKEAQTGSPQLTSVIEVVVDNFDQLDETTRSTIKEKIGQEEIPPAVLEVITDFPEQKQREAKGMLQIGRAAYAAVSELSGKVDPSRPKDDARQIYSLADGLSSAIVSAGLKELFPEYAHLDEEQEKANELADKEKCWITDPVDGSAGIVRGLNTWAVGFSLHEKQDVEAGGSGITLGCVISPQGNSTDVVFGGKEVGAYDWQGRPVSVSSTTEAKDLSFSVGSRDVREMKWIASLQALGREGSRVYAGVDTQHASTWLARGSVDILVRVEQPSYDIGPVIAITEGAGGNVREMNGQLVEVQRDKVRRHDLIAWNGTEEMIHLFDHVLNSDMDAPTSNGGSLIESLRTGTKYSTHTTLLRKGKQIFLQRTDRFGQGAEWDFSARLIDEPSQKSMSGIKKWQNDPITQKWLNGELAELPKNSPEVPLSISLDEFKQLVGRFKVEVSRDNLTVDNLPIGVEFQREINPNMFLQDGGNDYEHTSCMVVDVPQDQEVETANVEGEWVDIDDLLAIVKEWNRRDSLSYKGIPISPVLARALKTWDEKPYQNAQISEDGTFYWVSED